MAILAMLVLVPALGEGAERAGGPKRGRVLVAEAMFPSAMVALPDGGLLFAERATGRVRQASASGEVAPTAVAEVAVSTDGQRGLLGLAVDLEERIFASWTEPAGRLVVAQVASGPVRSIWRGPISSDRANGGRLAVDSQGGIVIGIGDLEQRRLVDDPSTPNGKLLRLDPDGPEEQAPAVISAGWNNPFAFTFTPSGELWVADNAPGDEPERLTQGDRRGPVTQLPAKTVPSGVAARDDQELLVCGYRSRRLVRYRVDAGRAIRGRTLVDDCRLGVAVLADGRAVYATESAIRVVPRSALVGR